MDDSEDAVPELVPTDEAIANSNAQSQQPSRRDPSNKVPVTILTGFLGSGKTTLVMDLLSDATHGKRIAVILNEFGESSGIDKSLSVGKDGKVMEEWLELDNG
eukprot:jgi/Hompol1/3733/HPOL_006709-RA